MEISIQIEEVRRRLGLTKNKIAELLGMSIKTYSNRLEKNNWSPLELKAIKKLEKFNWNQVL